MVSDFVYLSTEDHHLNSGCARLKQAIDLFSDLEFTTEH